MSKVIFTGKEKKGTGEEVLFACPLFPLAMPKLPLYIKNSW
jgi:hypothetical protein